MDLHPGNLHIWQIPFANSINANQQSYLSLSAAEQAHANQISIDLVKNQFVFYRAALRNILSEYLVGTAANAIAFQYSQFKKPFLNIEPALYFNLSHSHDVGVVAISRDGELGIDIERIRKVFNPALAERYFTALEYQQCMRASEHERALLFTRYWTKKEAIIKAAGLGIANHLKSFDVITDAAILFANQYWLTQEFNLSSDYITTAAYRHAPTTTNFFDYRSIFISG